jgi:hypothetical protein
MIMLVVEKLVTMHHHHHHHHRRSFFTAAITSTIPVFNPASALEPTSVMCSSCHVRRLGDDTDDDDIFVGSDAALLPQALHGVSRDLQLSPAHLCAAFSFVRALARAWFL